jgi:hypothetical protein
VSCVPCAALSGSFVRITETECAYCAARDQSSDVIRLILPFNGRAVAQAVSRRPLTAAPRVCSHVSPCEICGGHSDTMTGFSPSTSVFPCPCHSSNALYPSSCTCCSYKKDKGAKTVDLLSEIGEVSIAKCLQFLLFKGLQVSSS